MTCLICCRLDPAQVGVGELHAVELSVQSTFGLSTFELSLSEAVHNVFLPRCEPVQGPKFPPLRPLPQSQISENSACLGSSAPPPALVV